MAAVQGAISKRRKFVADGVFYAELNEFFQRELAEEGYSGVEVRVTPTVTDISTSQPRKPFISVRSLGEELGWTEERWEAHHDRIDGYGLGSEFKSLVD